MNLPHTCRLALATAALLVSTPTAALAQDFIGLGWSGELYRIDGGSANASLIANTGIAGWGGLEYGPNGKLFGYTTDVIATLYEVDPSSGAVQVLGPLNAGFVFEGGLAIAPDGSAWGTSIGSSLQPQLFSIDLTSGTATPIGLLSGSKRDINGLAWRTDGMLVGMDRAQNVLLEIDPVTATTTTLQFISSTVGANGGMVISGGRGYFTTSGPGASIPGSNELWSFDPYTGDQTLVGSLAPTVQGFGIAGLTIVGPILATPEPSIAGAVNSMTATGMQPSALVTFVFSSGLGSIPLDPLCPGLALDLDSVLVRRELLADANGVATLDVFVGSSLAGLTLYAQALDLTDCSVGNLIQFTLE